MRLWSSDGKQWKGCRKNCGVRILPKLHLGTPVDSTAINFSHLPIKCLEWNNTSKMLSNKLQTLDFSLEINKRHHTYHRLPAIPITAYHKPWENKIILITIKLPFVFSGHLSPYFSQTIFPNTPLAIRNSFSPGNQAFFSGHCAWDLKKTGSISNSDVKWWFTKKQYGDKWLRPLDCEYYSLSFWEIKL